MKTIKLFVFGAGGHGRELASYVADLRRSGGRIDLRGYLDDGLVPGRYGGVRVLGPVGVPLDLPACFVTAFGSNPVRRDVVHRLVAHYGDRLRPWTLIHPQSCIGEDVAIGEGSCIAPGVVLTTQLAIGRHCIVNVNASVSHDCTIGDFVNINPGAILCGAVAVGQGAYIGAGAVLKERVSIGAWSVVGAGAVVVRDVPPGVTVVGVPAHPLRQG